MEPTRLQEKIGDAAQLMKALSNQHRLAILCQLVDGEKSVGELVAQIGLSQSALSQHLARLRRDRLVRTRRAAQMIFYTLDGVQARVLLDTLHELYCLRRLGRIELRATGAHRRARRLRIAGSRGSTATRFRDAP
jgi:DNA-binding transcriptional ArsR family regulator